MGIIKTAYSWNIILSISLIGWLVAQILKTVINYFVIGEFNLERMWGAGGMPSAQSSTVCAMVIATGRYVGVHSPVFAMAFVLAVIVMYDAMGVRRETGEQAKVLNRMISEWMDQNTGFFADKKLKEMGGHTPFEVLTGAVLGTVLGFVLPIL